MPSKQLPTEYSSVGKPGSNRVALCGCQRKAKRQGLLSALSLVCHTRLAERTFEEGHRADLCNCRYCAKNNPTFRQQTEKEFHKRPQALIGNTRLSHLGHAVKRN